MNVLTKPTYVKMTRLTTYFVFFAFIAGLASTTNAQTYDTLRVATYNLLNYPGTNSSARNPEFRKTLRAMDPDVLIVQEMQSSTGVNEFLTQVLNSGQPGTYSSAPFSNGPDTDNALFYKSSRVSFLSQVVLATALRDINGYVLRPAGVTADSLDFRIYSAHLKASQGFEGDREAEATIVRDHLNALGPGHYLFGGDFNLYTSAEPAYQVLLGSQVDNDGRLYDVLGQPGDWHNTSSFASIHTQSPRLNDIGDGGSTGGLDDRFDFLLPTYSFQNLPSWRIIPTSYTEFGNDGLHFGQSVNNGTNTAVPDSIANALFVSSDHLPVFFDMVRQVTASSSVTLLQPNGSQGFGEGDTVSITWSTANYTGTVSISLSRTGAAGLYETLVSGTANDGQFSWVASGPPTTQARVKIILDGAPTTIDISDADFTISDRDISIFTPATGDSFSVGLSMDIQWTATNVPGNVRIELKRTPSSSSWEVLSASAPNSGLFGWVVTSPLSDSARVRVLVASAPSVGDSSGLFKIKSSSSNHAPSISYNPVCDAVPGNVVYFCKVQDDGGYDAPYLHWSANGFATKDSVLLSSVTGGYSTSHSFVSGFYDYYFRVTDSGGLTAYSDTNQLAVQPACATTITYDDGSAESYQWSSDGVLRWAVRFTPPASPFVLCAAQIAASVRKPDSLHGLLDVMIMDDNGPGGLPGDTLAEFSSGVVPNQPSGNAGTSPGWGRTVLLEAGGSPVVVTGDFYISVSALSTAFAMDHAGSAIGRSFLWDPCDADWFPENGVQPNTRSGQRMIRANGYALLPPSLVISSSGNDAVLRWTSTGAPQYTIFRSALPDGPFVTPIATVSDTTWSDIGVIPSLVQAFYLVRSSIP